MAAILTVFALTAKDFMNLLKKVIHWLARIVKRNGGKNQLLIIEKNGIKYLVVKDKAMEIKEFKIVNGQVIPVIKTWVEHIKHADGRQDAIVHVPCLQATEKVQYGINGNIG